MFETAGFKELTRLRERPVTGLTRDEADWLAQG